MYPVRLLTLLFGVGLAGLAGAQPSAPALRVTVLDARTGEPLAGALVSASAADSSWIPEVLTGPSGVRLLTLPRTGSVRVRVRRIGFAPWRSEPIEVPVGRTATVTARVDAAAITLSSVEVRSPGVCVMRPTAASAAGVLWEEARKALQSSVLVQRDGSTPLVARRFERLLGLNARLERETPAPAQLTRERPFRTRSAAVLSRDGWAQVDSSGTLTFDAPDEASLLSAEFERDHCFQLARDERPGLVGLAFAPAADRTLPDIAGTIWLNVSTAALTSLEYRYRNLPVANAGTDLGGEVAFTRLDDGRWIVSSWRIRMPRLTDAPGGARLTGYIEQGGTTSIATPDDAQAIGAAVGSLEGLVYDSLSGNPLGDALVRVTTTGQEVRSDPAGWFLLDLLPAGRYDLSVTHPQLDSLALPLAVRVRVDSARAAQLVLATPSIRTLRQRTCPDTLGRGRDVLVLGQVRDAGTGAPIDKAGALLKWFETGKNVRGYFDVKPKEAAAFSDAAGSFRACIPRGIPFSIAGVAETMSGEIEYAATDEQVLGITLWVDRDSTAALRGSLSGVVRDSLGKAVFGATIALDGIPEFTRTDSTGSFSLRGLPVGSRMIDIRRLGYAATRRPIVVRAGTTEPIAVVLSPAQTLAARRITGTRALSAKLRGFEERRRLGFGTFFDANQLDFFKNTTTTAVIRRVPSITVMRVPADMRVTDADIAPGSEVITMPSASQGLCYANIIIDGRPASQAEFWAYRPEDFVGLEVYPRASTVPAAFGNLRNGCGAVVAWTK